jgi:MFS transporter, MCT family, solute carrier family 16 (monocarboxylic acid transporters), member 10
MSLSTVAIFQCLVSGRLLDIGYLRAPLLVASVSLVFCLFMTAQCTQYWQFMLSQGVTLGVCMLVYDMQPSR